VPTRGKQHYYGSYGVIRGYGPLCKTIDEADKSVFDDGRLQRRNGGSTDRNAVLVSKDTGLCWWADEDEGEGHLEPVRTPSSGQAKYAPEVIRSAELMWGDVIDSAGAG
jgi:hypothetical protein